MSAIERQVTFTLLGQEYSVLTSTSDVDLHQVLNLIQEVLEPYGSQLAKRSTISTNRQFVLACLTLASRVIELQQEMSDCQQQIDRKIMKLVENIESRLDDKKMDKNV